MGDVLPLQTRSPALAEDEVAQLADMFRLLGDGSRLRIVLGCLEGCRSVGALAAELGLSQSLVSHHLRLLRAARLLRAERHGKQVHYSISDDHVRSVLVDMVAHVGEEQAAASPEGDS